MFTRLLIVAGLATWLTGCASPAGPSDSTAMFRAYAGASYGMPQEAPQEAEEPVEAVEESRGFGHRLLWYIPNRISDVLDIVRARVRVGPGFGVGVRATELADVYLGSYATVFVGVPGPRGERSFNWPFGFESLSGAEISVAEATVEGGIGPNYGLAEFGVSLHVLIIGIDVGVDPLEIVDLAVGLLTFDILADDI